MDMLRSLGTTSLRTAVMFLISGLVGTALFWWALSTSEPGTAQRVSATIGLAVGTVLVIVNGVSVVHLLRHPHCQTPPLVRSPRMLTMQRWSSISVVTALFVSSTSGFERGRTGPIMLVVVAVISAVVCAVLWLAESRRARSAQRNELNRVAPAGDQQ